MIKNKDLRTFGYIWFVIFLIISLFPLKNGNDIRDWSLVVSIIFFTTSTIFPQLFKIVKFYQLWIKFGNFIGKVNSKIIIFILFYFLFLPIGIILKIFRKDLLGKIIDSSATSYFIDRKEQPKDMQNQF